MITIDTIGKISPDGDLLVKLPTKLPPGERRVVVVLDEEQLATPASELPTFSIGNWPEGLTLRREDTYGDEGR